MPFIGGRYYANALAGHAIEAAREAEAGLLELKRKDALNGNAADGPDQNGADPDDNEQAEPAGSLNTGGAPLHRVEIEAAELVPSHTGRAQRGFVARVHRDPGSTNGALNVSTGSRSALPGQVPSRGYAPKPETHVFAGHSDLLDFLKNELRDKGNR